MSITGAVAIVEQKAFAEIQADRERLEVLAKKRVDLKMVLDKVLTHDGVWMASTNASFFLFGSMQSSEYVMRQLDEIEDELKGLCHKLKGLTT